jgi:hypothetical protein
MPTLVVPKLLCIVAAARLRAGHSLERECRSRSELLRSGAGDGSKGRSLILASVPTWLNLNRDQERVMLREPRMILFEPCSLRPSFDKQLRGALNQSL